MYYRLVRRYRLRGWEKLPYALLDEHVRTVQFFTKPVMETLVRCDGSWDFDSPLVSDDARKMLAQLLEQGLVETCEPGAHLDSTQAYRFFPNRYVQSAHWSITGACNYRCRHCFMSAPEARYGQLSHDATLAIARQIGSCGIPRVSLTGGEPLLRPDFLDIVSELSEQDVAVTQLYTNGSLLTDTILDGLTARGQHPVIIMSFDGCGHHDWLRGVQGAEQAADKAFRLCRDKGFRVHAQMCLHRRNVDTMGETIRYLSSVGCASVRVGSVSDAGDWLRNGQGLTLTREEFYEASLRYIPEFYGDGMPVSLVLSGVFAASPESPEWFSLAPCRPQSDNGRGLLFSCARMSPQIYADGRIAICDEFGPDFVGMPPLASDERAQTTTLAEVLMTGSPYMKLMDLRRQALLDCNLQCASCPHLSVCGGGCRAKAHATDGSLLGRDPVTCAFFREGWAQRVIDTVREACPSARLAHGSEVLASL